MTNYSQIQKIMLGWDCPWMQSAVQRCKSLINSDHEVSLGGYFFVLPTTEATRLFREELAEAFAPQGGVLDLNVGLPEFLLGSEGEVASDAQVLSTWAEVLRKMKISQYSGLFDLPFERWNEYRKNYTYLLRIAAALQNCRLTLGSEGLTLRDVHKKLDDFCRECGSEDYQKSYSRFQEFYRLEQEYLSALPSYCVDKVQATIKSIQHVQLDDKIKKIILIGCHELKGAVRQALTNSNVSLECWIGAPENYRDAFDDWGMIRSDFVDKLSIDLDFAGKVRCFSNSAEQSSKILDLIYNGNFTPGAIGILNNEIAENIEYKNTLFYDGKISFYSPLPQKLSTHPWTRLFELILSLGSFADLPISQLGELLRNGLFQNYLTNQLKLNDILRILALFDELQSEHLLNTQNELWYHLNRYHDANDNRYAALKKAIVLIMQWQNELMSSPADQLLSCSFNLLEKCGQVYAVEDPTEYEYMSTELTLLGQLIVEINHCKLPRENISGLFQVLSSQTQIQFKRDNECKIDLVGFLELPWRNDPTLLIAGFNEESFNYGAHSDIFLPEQIKIMLGILNAKQRYETDVFRFFALTQSHEIAVLYAKANSAGDLLHPARLLLHCQIDLLPERTKWLFSNLLEESFAPNKSLQSDDPAGKHFILPEVELKNKMSITGFGSYLSCPFKFFRENILHTREINDRMQELDFMQFGTLLHAVLERYAPLDQSMTSSNEIRECCERLFEQVLKERYNLQNYGVVNLQLDLLSHNLEYFAQVQFDNCHANNWRIVTAEKSVRFNWNILFDQVFPEAPPEAWRSQILISGKIDRIDLQLPLPGENSPRQWRIIDYKSSNKAKKPLAEHCKSFRTVPEEWRFAATVGKKNLYWTNLQLPLYWLILKYIINTELGVKAEDQISSAYFCLPLAYSDTRIEEFEELKDFEMIKQAVICADEVLKKIFVEHKFWPPTIYNSNMDRYCELLGGINANEYVLESEINKDLTETVNE